MATCLVEPPGTRSEHAEDDTTNNTQLEDDDHKCGLQANIVHNNDECEVPTNNVGNKVACEMPRNIVDTKDNSTEENAVTIYNRSEGETSGGRNEAEIRADILSKLETLQERIDNMKEIPKILWDVPLKCLQQSTMQHLSYHLDPESDIMTDNDCLKDYRGLAELIGLENVFIKFISHANYHMLKTSEVLSKWLTSTEPPAPTLGNLQKFLKEMERDDVLEDMSVKMAKDAVKWKMTEYEASTENPRKEREDTSWQLTRHDVVSGKKTMYTAGLVYADEDELSAQLIIKLYKKAYTDALFFIPNFDLKTGKYVLDTTAKVISERCDHKVVFLLSEYFYASEICQFAVSYAAAHGTGNGNLIPFHLTRNIDAVPNVLRGIAGIRWFRKATRKHTWTILTNSLLDGKVSEELLVDVKDKISNIVERDEDYYLQDPPYDANVPPPGKPYPVIEPEGLSSMPPEMQSMDLQEREKRERESASSTGWKFLKQVKRAIVEKVLKVSRPAKKSTSSVEMANVKSRCKTMALQNECKDPAANCDTMCSSKKKKAEETFQRSVNSEESGQEKLKDGKTSSLASPECEKLLAKGACASTKHTKDSPDNAELDPLMSK